MILKYLKAKEWALIAVVVALIVGQVYLDLRIPEFMNTITRILMEDTPAVSDVVDQGWGMIACALGSLAMAIMTGYIAAWVAASLSRRLREMQFSKVQAFSMGEINKFSTASLITRSTNDITQVQMAVAIGLQVTIKAPILAVWAIAKIVGKGTEWTILTAVAVMAILLIVGIVMVFVIPRFKKIQWLTDDVNRVTREGLTGIRVVRAYNAEDYQEAKFGRSNDALTSNNMFVNRMMSVMMPALTSIMSLLSLSIYWMGAILLSSSPSLETFSNMIVFSSYAMQVVMAFILMIFTLMILPRAIVAAKRIEEVIDTEPSIVGGDVTESPEGMAGNVEFRNVSFKYPNAADYVLKDISFTANKGETVAFIGSTGSGKSTLINLVPRFYDASHGSVLVDGVDVREYDLDALRRKIGYVSQKAVMFTGTVSSNVTYGDDPQEIVEADIMRAVAIAQGTEFVERMEERYNSRISQGGTNLSGGQKQRLSIARAVNRGPELYIFDDSFSALDYKTDRALRDALESEVGGATCLIVAQRVGTIMDADKIIVLEEGQIVGMGRHRELLRNCETYKEIAMSQLSEEELAL